MIMIEALSSLLIFNSLPTIYTSHVYLKQCPSIVYTKEMFVEWMCTQMKLTWEIIGFPTGPYLW